MTDADTVRAARDFADTLRQSRAGVAAARAEKIDALCDLVDRLVAERDALAERCAAYEEPGWINPVQKVMEERRRAEAAEEALEAKADEFLALIGDVEAERDRLRSALEQIQEWDCLNPPDPNLCADHPWLKRLVDEALGKG